MLHTSRDIIELFINCCAISAFESKRDHTLSKKRQSKNELVVTYKGAKYGAFAGFIAGWAPAIQEHYRILFLKVYNCKGT